MIVAIADDLTGAAEIGGIGLQLQMDVEIEMKLDVNSDADLLVLATDMRSLSVEVAKSQIQSIAQKISKLAQKPELIYMKVDSVLRGHVVAELDTLIKALNKDVALLVPANPHLGRTIEEGSYFINGRKLYETGFKNDPQFAIRTSSVKGLLEKETDAKVVVIPPGKNIPTRGIVVGEAASEENMRVWAKRVKRNVLPSGAVGFFSAIMKENNWGRAMPVEKPVFDIGKKKLFVCGSAFVTSKKLVKKAIKDGKAVSLMPDYLMQQESAESHNVIRIWAEEVVALFKTSDAVIVAIDPEKNYNGKFLPDVLKSNMALLVQTVTKLYSLQELFIEGGATAFSILNRLGITRICPKTKFSNGVIRMHLPNNEKLHVTLKPGSYEWPEFIRPI